MASGRPAPLVFLVLTAVLTVTSCAGDSGNPAPGVTDSDLLFADTFGPESSGAWVLEGDEVGSTAIQDGRLVIDVTQSNSMQYATLDEPTFTDFDLVVEAQLVEGGYEATYGLLFGMVDPEQFYRFELTGDGHFVVERRDTGGAWQRLISGWENSPAILSGQGAMNSLRVTTEGPAMQFYVNEQLLTEVQDGNYSGGKIALDAGTFGAQRTIVAFDNLAIRRP
jgi:Tfp pilus assembly protein PilW